MTTHLHTTLQHRGEPTVRHVRRRPLDVPAYEGHLAKEGDYAQLITESTILYDDDERRVVLAYVAPIAEDCTDLVAALRRLKIGTFDRTGGLKSQGSQGRGLTSRSEVFGYVPRQAAFSHDACTIAKLAQVDPDAHALLCAFAPVVAAYYRRYQPGAYAAHQHLARQVHADYVIEDSPFTSGIVNRDSRMTYHFDRGNFQHVWSNMLGFKGGVTGGYLSVPQYNLGFEIADKSLLMFDGQGLLHGVTKIGKTEPHGYRLTVVFYSLVRMWSCEPPADELTRARRVTREREQRKRERSA